MTPRRDSYISTDLIHAVKELIQSCDSSIHGVCFDYFDTLVHRNVSPEYTKRLAARQLATVSGLQLSPRAVYEFRREVEIRLCNTSVTLGRDAEFSLYDLADGLYDFFKIAGSAIGDRWKRSEFIDIVADIEVAVECQVQEINKTIVEFLWWLKANRISVYLISDFYLPLAHFRKMLEEHKLEGLFSEVFISADHGLTKASGRLYQKVLQELGGTPQQFIMVGDNIHSDYAVPADAGIQSFLLHTEEKRIFYSMWEEKNSTHSLRAVNLSRKMAECLSENCSQFFPEMGMTLWYFTVKLFKQLNRDKVRDVFFCSKEGEFLKTLFDQFQKIVYGRQVIESHYLMVSRKATFICSLRPLYEETFERLFAQYRDLSIEEFLLSLNFSMRDVSTICAFSGLTPEGRRSNLQEHPDFKKLLQNEGFQQRYEEHRCGQKSVFLHYLKSFGVEWEKNGIAMVDVGWKGSIQNNIYHTFNEEIPVHGYYIGLLSPSGLTENNRKSGIVFSDYPKHTPYIHVYNNNRSLFEMLLGASHGSADGYFPVVDLQKRLVERGSTMGPVFAGEKECAVTTLDLPEERKLFQQAIAPLQHHYLQLFTDVTQMYVRTEAALPDEEWFARIHSRMVFRPRRAEIDFFSELYHLENFGLFEFTHFSSDTSIGLREKFYNFRKLLRSPAAFLETGIWPPIILKRMGLDFLQPIDGIKRYRRIFGEET
jgi:FMN phosphatase YigB (HAD superfamily)